MSVLVLGTVALDNVKTPYGRRLNMLGGSAVHFAMSCRLFTTVHLVAIVGEDFPKEYIRFLKQKGLILTALIEGEGKTFKWQGAYEGDLNTALTLSTELGVLIGFKPSLSRAQRKIRNIFLANLDPDIQRHLLKSIERPRLIGLDSMNYWIKHKPKSLVSLMKKVDIYVANDQEARSLSGEYNLISAAKALRKLGPKIVLIKKGEHGTLFYDGELTFSLPAYPVAKVVDPTGAGDTFAGGLIGYLSCVNKINAQAIKKAVAYGTATASFNVEGFGLERTALLSREDLKKRFLELKRLVSL